MKKIGCEFCGEFLVYANCTKLAFPVGEFLTEIEFKKARYLELRCGNCKEITTVRNPRVWK